MRLIPSSLRLRLLLLASLILLPVASLLLFYWLGGQGFSANLLALLLTGIAVLVAAWTGGTWLVIHPVRALLKAALKASAGDLTARSSLDRADGEFGQLAAAFDTMAMRLQEREHDQQAIRLAMAKSDEDYRSLFDHSPMPMWVYDQETLSFMAVNGAAVGTYGYSQEEFLAMTIKDIRRPEDIPELLTSLPELSPAAPAFNSCQHRIKSGSQIDVEMVSHSITFLGRRGRIVLVNNITERKRMEVALTESERQHRQLFEHNPMPIAVYEIATLRILAVNDAAVSMYGYSREEFRRITLLDLCFPEDRAAVVAKLEALPPQSTRTSNWRHMRRDGSQAVVETVSHPIEFEGRPARIVLAQDITARKRAEDALRESESYHRRLFETSPIGLVLCTFDMRFVDANPAFGAIIGRSVEKVKQMAYADISPHGPDAEEERQQQRLRRTGRFGPYEKELLHADGHRVAVRLSGLIIERDGSRYVWSSIEDITDAKQAEHKILYLAHHDAVTGLPNRNLLRDRLAHDIACAEREHKQLALLFIDLDRFKNINDTLGHETGDVVLQAVAQTLTHCVRDSDTVARLGGDEFVIVLPEIVSSHDATVVAQKIISRMAEPLAVRGHRLHITPSIGLSIFPDDGEDAISLMKNADAAMYGAKEAGRNNYQFFTREMHAAAMERLAVENSLRQALENEEFVLYYQPLWDIKRNVISELEALVRWKHPDWGLVLPLRFIHVAEECGLIDALGRWVLQEACRQTKAWHTAGFADLSVSVNLSTRQFNTGDLFATVVECLEKADLDGRYLGIEVTESVMIRDRETVIATLTQLKRIGIKVSIDDFGTGYSSLAYLRQLPVDQIKIDKSFVRNVLTDPGDAAIARAIIAMGQSLKLRVAAEGVETMEQIEFLKALSCDKVQGNYLFKPLPVSAMTAVLTEIRLEKHRLNLRDDQSLQETHAVFRRMATRASYLKLVDHSS